VVLWVGTATAILAASIGLFQNDIKKVLAYSTVSQLGYMFVALGLGAYSAGMFHVTTHAFFKALLFLGAGSVIHALAGEQDIRKMGGLKGTIKVTHLTFLLGTLAIAGIPPFSGFFSKDAILANAFDRSPVLYALLLGGALITTFYMFRLYFLTFWGTYRGDKHPHESPAVMTVPLLVLAVLSVVGGLLNLPHVFGGHEPMKHFLAYAADGIGAERLHLPASTEWILMGLSTTLVLLVILMAHGRFAKKPTLDPEADALPFLPRLLARKWYLDELYERLFEKPYGWLSTMFHRVGEGWVMVPLMNGAGRLTQRAGQVLRLAQTGNMSFYLFAMVAGIVVFLLMTLYGR
jgi:NADH-quinone oxidoreductase subunit L